MYPPWLFGFSFSHTDFGSLPPHRHTLLVGVGSVLTLFRPRAIAATVADPLYQRRTSFQLPPGVQRVVRLIHPQIEHPRRKV